MLSKATILHVTYVDFVATQSEVTKNQRKIKHFNYFPLRRRTISKDENSAYIFAVSIINLNVQYLMPSIQPKTTLKEFY